MEEISIERQGIPNLDFSGDLIGQSAGPTPRVKIYRTKAQKFVGEVKVNQKMSDAQHYDKPDGVINWFKNTYGIIAEVEDAIEDAAKHDDAFKTAWNEHID